jgi:type IV secretory pathway VirB10-like protein
MSGEPIAEAPPPKVDPETLVLRGTPARVVRFRRGAIIAIAALGSTALAGISWMALKPATLGFIATGEERGEPGAKAPADALADAPRSYADVPRLGPPLPGDLGRPILAHQREIGAAPAATGGDAARRAAQAAEAERQRIAAERTAARESGIMMQVAGSKGTASGVSLQPAVAVAEAKESTGSNAAIDLTGDPNGQRRKADFLNGTGSDDVINPHRLVEPVSPFTLSAGSILSGSLITGLNSDLPGLVSAQVTENAYDSVTGRILLIPQGSRLVGSYDSVVAFGQRRALVVWQRIILPDGSSLRIDNLPATDLSGYTGLSDSIDRHSWQLLKGAVLSTLLGVGTELSLGSNESDLLQALRESTQQSASRAGDQLVARSLDIQPTLKVRPGWPLRIVVHKDLVLRPWRKGTR